MIKKKNPVLWNKIDFLFFFVLVFLNPILCEDCRCCVFDTDEGKINLTPISLTYYHYSLPDQQHKYTFILGKNIEKESEKCQIYTKCKLGNLKDEINLDYCYYAGGVSECFLSKYDEKTKSVEVHYPGKKSSEETPHIRNFFLTVKCNESVVNEPVITNCESEKVSDHESNLKCQMQSAWGCVNWPYPKNNISSIVLIMSIIIAACSGVGVGFILFYLFGACSFFTKRKQKAFRLKTMTFSQPAIKEEGYIQIDEKEKEEEENEFLKDDDDENDLFEIGDEHEPLIENIKE